jgi:hypothetical protein
MTTDLLTGVLDAHGGINRWRQFSRIEATIVSGGLLFELKGMPQDSTPRRMTAALQHEWSSIRPFGDDDQRTDFTPDRVAIEKLDGSVVAERTHPRDSFTGHTLDTPWDPLQRAYFNGYALWTYLTSPFLLALPGLSVLELEPVDENGLELTGLQVRFGPNFASHSLPSNIFRTSRRPTASGCPPRGGRTGVVRTAGRSFPSSWCRSTSPTATSHRGNLRDCRRGELTTAGIE